MALRAISHRKRKQADLDLSAGSKVAPRENRAMEEELFEAPWEEPPASDETWAPGRNGPELASATTSSPTEELRAEGPTPPAGKVVLAVGRPYFHDGTVGEGLYEADLPLTLLAAFDALHVLARAIFVEMGAPQDAELTIYCDCWSLRLGPEPGQAQLVQHDAGAPTPPPRKERRADQWLRGVASLRQADHAKALAAFEAEAATAVANGSPQRAAVAFRAAAASARSIGRADHSNRLLRLAGKSYLEIAEGATTLPQGVFSAYREAARAFLEAGNLPLAQQCLTKALAVGEALGLLERG